MHRIRITNFKMLKDVEIDVNDMLIVMGEQASGKSTLAKLIFYFKSLPQDFIDIIFENIEDNGIDLQKMFWSKIRRKFYDYFGSTKHLKDFSVVYTYKDSYHLALSLHEDRTMKIDVAPAMFDNLFYGRIRNLITNIRNNLQQSNSYERTAFRNATGQLESFIYQQFDNALVPLFIPAGRNITVSYSEQFKLNFFGGLVSDLAGLSRETLDHEDAEEKFFQAPQSNQSVDIYLMVKFLQHTAWMRNRFGSIGFEGLLEQGNQNEQATNHSSNLKGILTRINRIIKGRYEQDQFSEKLFFSENEYVHFRNASSGQQEAIRILQDAFLILYDNESAFRVIEEPEAHLYPVAQKLLMEVLAITLNGTDSQIIITTHSPYILSIANNLLYASKMASQYPNARDRVEEIVPSEAWLDPNKTSVYMLEDGRSSSVFNDEIGLIDQNTLDTVSEEIGADFEQLYFINAEASYE